MVSGCSEPWNGVASSKDRLVYWLLWNLYLGVSGISVLTDSNSMPTGDTQLSICNTLMFLYFCQSCIKFSQDECNDFYSYLFHSFQFMTEFLFAPSLICHCDILMNLFAKAVDKAKRPTTAVFLFWTAWLWVEHAPQNEAWEMFTIFCKLLSKELYFVLFLYSHCSSQTGKCCVMGWQ